MEGNNKFRIAKLRETRGIFQKNLFREIGIDAKATDLAKAIGIRSYKNSFGTEYEYWMTSTYDKIASGEYETDYYIVALGKDNDNHFESAYCLLGGRPMIESHFLRARGKKIGEKEIGIDVFEYGEYPQDAVDSETAKKLNDLRAINKLDVTGKSYQFNVYYDQYGECFEKEDYRDYVEYVYEGKKYIYKTDIELKNGVWLEVKPIEWYADTKNAISKNILFSGINNYEIDNYFTQYFSKNIVPSKGIVKNNKNVNVGNNVVTDIKNVKNNIFGLPPLTKKKKQEQTEQMKKEVINDIAQKLASIDKVEKQEVVIETNLEKKDHNPYNFDLSNVSEEDIIRGALESNIAVFLHGRSSEGKSARVKKYDPDCEIIYLRNATPESLNGKSVYNSETGEMIDIPPTWYKNLKEKCEAEPDKIHIVFFDEITNSLPSIQGMAYNIVLDKEVNGIWKLPENARVVAAGNEVKDSLAANKIAEPLFNRFAHVYIETTVDSWLDWAAEPASETEEIVFEENEVPMKIHPSIFSYIAYKYVSDDDVLRTPYNGETPNADPRKWEMASKILYATNKPYMLRSLIGEELTADFVAFCSEQLLTVDDVINHNYSDDVFNVSVSEKYATATGLAIVNEDNLEVVRDFVKKLGPEICSVFDVIWSRGNEKRLEKIMELKIDQEEMSL